MNDVITMPPEVSTAFDGFPEPVRARLLELRRLLFDVAARTAGSGTIVETIKWGQPSYLTECPKSGSTVRLGCAGDGRPALFCHCQTTLIGQFRDLYPDAFDFEGNRALVLKDGAFPQEELAHCVALALTYHRRRRAK